MTTPRDGAGDFERALELLGPILVSDSLGEAAALTARLFATLSGAEAVALFLVSGKDTGDEFWVPADEATRLRFRPHFRGLALESLVQNTPVTMPFPPGLASGLEPSVLPLVERGHTRALVYFAGAPGAGARCADAGALVARQIVQHQDVAQSRLAKARYERWFRQFDQQLRVLEGERQKFAAVVNQADTYVFTADPSRKVRWVSRAMTSRFPLDDGPSWVGRDCEEVWARFGRPAGSVPGPFCPVTRVLALHRPVRQEFVHDGGGPGHRLHVTALPIREPEGRIQEVLVVAQDLSGIELVRHMEEGLRAVVSNAPVVLFAVDREGIFQLSEGRALARLGLAPGQVVGLSAFEFYRDQPQIVAALQRALEGEDFTQLVEVGDAVFETHYTPRRDEAGEIFGVVGVATDVSERRQFETQLRESQRLEALGRLAANTANEFGDLLSVIMGNTELILGRLQQGHPLQRPAEELQRAGAQGARLVRQLLTLSQRETATPRPLDPDALLSEMGGLLRRLVSGDVELVTVPGSSPALVSADRAQLEQALVNLVVNTREALPRGGCITIERGTVELEAESDKRCDLPPGSYITLVVRGAGPGLDERTHTRLLDALLAGCGADSDARLGVPLAQNIVRRFGGDVVVRSEPGVGTAITVRLPSLEEAATPSLESPLSEAA
jgi:PAS domain S-box-containing protein